MRTIFLKWNDVVSTAKVQKIWEQFTTKLLNILFNNLLFRLQKYKKFESNSQRLCQTDTAQGSCFDCKSTKNLRAIHNMRTIFPKWNDVVSTAKVQKIWEQFTTATINIRNFNRLFRLQKYKKFESNSQPWGRIWNYITVVSTAKVQKIWEQFTTNQFITDTPNALFRLQKYKKFESNSQQSWFYNLQFVGCFDCKSTKNLRAIHNYAKGHTNGIMLFRLQKYKKFESNSQRFAWTLKIFSCCFDCKSTKNLRAIHNC